MKSRGKSHNSPRESNSLDRVVSSMRAQQRVKKFNAEKDLQEKKLYEKNN